MRTFLLYLASFALLCLFIFAQNYIERGKQINTLTTEKNSLSAQLKSKEKEIETYNQKQLEASGTIQQVREVIKKVKEPCDCYNTRLPDDALRMLHDNNK